MLDNILFTPKLTEKEKAYQFSEFCKHVRISVVPSVGAAFLLGLFSYQSQGNSFVWFWFAVMLLIQMLRYRTSKFSDPNSAPIQRRLFLAFVFMAGMWFVAFLFLFHSHELTHAEQVFRAFFVYMIFVFHLEVVRYDLRVLVFEVTMVTIGLIFYTLLSTVMSNDMKWLYSLAILFGGVNLFHYGRSNHLLVCEAYSLIASNETMLVKMDEMLVHDELTQQFNRRYFNAELNKYLEQFSHTKERFSLAIIDIDFFKKVNDVHGHVVGDAALIALADFIRKRTKKTDVFARYGGEEFVLILPKTMLDFAVKIIDKIRLNCDEKLFMLDGLPLHLTVSVGVTEVRAGDDDASILKRADDALYEAKQSGRNCIKKGI